jgi:SAM-dependent methyltransferase
MLKNNTFDFWKKVWDDKGNSNNDNILYLNGYEHLNYNFNGEELVSYISSMLEVDKFDHVLEIGCGAGFLTQYFDCIYTGIDYSLSLVERNKQKTRRSIFCCEAEKLFFPDKCFDKVFTFGVFQYFPNMEYVENVIREMVRVSKKYILIGDVKSNSERETHLTIEKEYFISKGFEISSCFYDKENNARFNAFLRIK